MYKKIIAGLVVIAVFAGSMLLAPSLVAAQSQPAPSDVSVPTIEGPSLTQQLTDRAKSSWPWYITRAAGLTAAVLLVVLVLSGVGLITGYTYKFLEPLNAWATHRALGLAFGVAVIVHIVALLFDRFVPFSIAQVLLPFASNYREVTIAGYHLGSLYVALGVFALYAILALIISSILWIDKKPHTWRILHYLSYLIVIFVFIHALYLGTDLAHGFFRIVWIIFGIAVAAAILARLRRARTI